MSVTLAPTKVAAALESTGMPIRVVECDPDYADTFPNCEYVVECDPDYADTFPYCEKYGVAAEDAANTIVDDIKADFDQGLGPDQ